MKGPSNLIPLAIFALITLFLFPLTIVNHLPDETPILNEAPIFKEVPVLRETSLPECGHILLVSAPRHGSTWFVDSVEGCPSTKTTDANYKQLIANSELWTTHEGPVYDVTPLEAANYVMNNCSLKLFPTLEKRGEERVKALFKLVKQKHIPVFLLTRNPQGAYASLSRAIQTGVWSRNKVNQSSRDAFVWDDEFDEYRQMLNTYFDGVRNLLMEEGLSWDEFDYDKIQEEKDIIGIKNRCYIKNCNFL